MNRQTCHWAVLSAGPTETPKGLRRKTWNPGGREYRPESGKRMLRPMGWEASDGTGQHPGEKQVMYI